jgi:predicted O-methyltransferase YrrM
MKFKEIKKLVAGVPYIMDDMAYDLYHFVLEQQPREVLELGFGHGASSCYIAAALEEIGTGHLTSVDLIPAKEWQNPAIEDLLSTTGLTSWVSVARENSSYTWFLQKKIMERTQENVCSPLYDFCFIDGAKNWTIDSSAFFLVDKLLNRDGWVVFDDLQWTYESKLKEGKKKSDGVFMLDMADDELTHPHVELIFQLLVMQHPEYSNFLVKDNWWGWAQKTRNGNKEVVSQLSDGYKARLAAWEEKNGVIHRAPFEPFDQRGKTHEVE